MLRCKSVPPAGREAHGTRALTAKEAIEGLSKHMRQLRTVLQVIVVATLLAGCGGSKASPTVAPISQNSSTIGSTATTTTGTASPSASTPASSQATPPVASPAGSTVATTPGAGSKFAYGFNVYARADADGQPYNQKVIDAVKGAGFGWVRLPIQWSGMERAKGQWDPLPVDRLVKQFNGSGIKILMTVSSAPDWARNTNGNSLLVNYSDYQDVMKFLAGRYKGKVQAWEVWNEENLASEMGGTVRVDDYARLLQAGYQGVKAGDPNALVVFGGLTPTGVNDPKVAMDDQQYLDTFYNYQGGFYTKFFDVLGVHTNATNHPPDQMYPDNPGTGAWSNSGSFYFRRAEQLRQVMQAHGDARPIWITEFGWTTANQAKGYEYGQDVSAQQQAQYLVDAFAWAHDHWPWATGMFVWNLNYSTVTQPNDEKYPWSVLNNDWSPRPSFDALKTMPKP